MNLNRQLYSFLLSNRLFGLDGLLGQTLRPDGYRIGINLSLTYILFMNMYSFDY